MRIHISTDLPPVLSGHFDFAPLPAQLSAEAKDAVIITVLHGRQRGLEYSVFDPLRPVR
jgi:hypothetical protein